MTNTKGTLNYLGPLAAVAALAAIGLGGIYAEHQAKTKAFQQNETRIAECIDLKGKAYNCGRIDLALADEETQNKVSPFIQKWKEEKAAAAKELAADAARAQQRNLAQPHDEPLLQLQRIGTTQPRSTHISKQVC